MGQLSCGVVIGGAGAGKVLKTMEFYLSKALTMLQDGLDITSDFPSCQNDSDLYFTME